MSDARLVEAIRAGHDFWFLLGIGADVNGKDKSGVTPLIAAVQTGNKSAIYALTASGADVDAVDSEGNSALIYAMRKKDSSLVTYLSALSDHQ